MQRLIHSFDFQVLYQHLDVFGHVNNAAYLQILEEARWDLIENNDYGLKKILSTQKGPTILDIQIRFAKELNFKDKGTVKIYVPEKLKKIMPIYQEIHKDDELCCSATFKFAFFDLKQRKIIPPTEDWLKAIKMN